MGGVVVVLAVQWGYRGDRVARWFAPNPYNHSGGRLIKLIGHGNFLMTNACSDIVYTASQQGTPDACWLRCNLKVLRPAVVLVCGKVACATFKRGMVGKATKVFRLPHPAARTWSKATLARWAKRIQRHT